MQHPQGSAGRCGSTGGPGRRHRRACARTRAVRVTPGAVPAAGSGPAPSCAWPASSTASPPNANSAASAAASYAATSPSGIPNSNRARRASGGTCCLVISRYASSSLPSGSTMSSPSDRSPGTPRFSASDATRSRSSSTVVGAGLAGSISAIRPASRIVKVERTLPGTILEHAGTLPRRRDQHEVGRADHLFGDLRGSVARPVGAERLGDDLRPRPHAPAHRRPEPRARHLDLRPQGRREVPVDPSLEQHGSERRTVDVARADHEHRERLRTHCGPLLPSSTDDPTRPCPDRVSVRSLEGVRCAY